MSRLMLIFFVSLELCYYLLIVQTGIVEHFSSNIYFLAPLPIGGVIGSLLSFYLKTTNSNKISFFLIIQFMLSLFYPNLSQIMLFLLGVCAGALAPLMIHELKKATATDLGLSLSVSYIVGTFLFNYEASKRGDLAIFFTCIVFISSRFLPKEKAKNYSFENHSLLMMMLWIFLDSALFESLSRDLSIPIWRGGFSYEIAIFHILGIIASFSLTIGKNQKELLIIILFAFSYLLYFLREAYLLSMIYPFVISYYNIVILQSILKKDFKTIGIYMVFIGWVASGAGLFVAVENFILFVPVTFLLIFFGIINTQTSKNKEIRYV